MDKDSFTIGYIPSTHCYLFRVCLFREFCVAKVGEFPFAIDFKKIVRFDVTVTPICISVTSFATKFAHIYPTYWCVRALNLCTALMAFAIGNAMFLHVRMISSAI